MPVAPVRGLVIACVLALARDCGTRHINLFFNPGMQTGGLAFYISRGSPTSEASRGAFVRAFYTFEVARGAGGFEGGGD